MRDRRRTAGLTIRCAIYTRKSTEEGLDQDFNSLDAQREACSAYILSQRHEGWVEVPGMYEDGGFSGGNMERPGLKALLAEIALGKVQVIVVYKVDRLTRSLADFAKIVEILDARQASFVSVTQAFNTTSSMGRLTLNVLLSFAQFEREVTSERIRDKIAASKARGMWMGGPPPLGYDVVDRKLVADAQEAETVGNIFRRYLELGSVPELVAELDTEGVRSKGRTSRNGRSYGGARISRGALYVMLKNRLYVGDVEHKGNIYAGQHEGIIDRDIFDAAGRLLAEGRVERSLGSGSPDPSLLAGLLRDQHRRRMSPSHASKRSRRYRYYVSQADGSAARAEPRWRISAPDIEQRVVSLLIEQLRHQEREVIGAGNWRGEDIQRLQQNVIGAIDGLTSGTPREARRLVLDCATAVDLHQDEVRLSANFGSVDPLLGDAEALLMAPVNSIRSAKQLRLVIPPAGEAEVSRKSPALIKLVTQAIAARDIIANSHATDFGDLAREIGYSREHAANLLKVAFLAPDIIAGILDGLHPAGLTRTKLTRWPALPLDWNEQRQVLGFAAA